MAKKKTRIILVAGARPNFPKIAPIMRAMKRYPTLAPMLVHTGQHYDPNMSQDHILDLGIAEPDLNLGVGSGTHGQQTAQVLEKFEKVLIRERPALVLVVGDVNSTLACALAAVKLHIRVAHIEAGLRSFDREMPEEVNRVVADSIGDFLFTHSREADENLVHEGIPRKKIFFVGNVMIDTLDYMLPRALRLPSLTSENYGLITLHRPSNVDDAKSLRLVFETFERIAKDLPLFFPVHPRTRASLDKWKISINFPHLHLIEPLSYLPFLKAMAEASILLTDSGGIQEETTALGVPCLTLRKNSERMVTVHQGTNIIVGNQPENILRGFNRAMKTKKTSHRRPPLWDGKASHRIVKILRNKLD